VTDLSAVNTSTGSLTVDGVLTMGTGGSITNTAQSYFINNDGISIDSSGGLGPTKSIKWFSGVNSLLRISGFTDPEESAEIETSGKLALVAQNGIELRDGISQITFTGTSGLELDSSILVSIFNNTASTSSTTGALQVAGGIGVGGNSFFTGTVSVANATAGGHAVNRTTGDGRYLQLSALNDVGAASATNNRSIDISFGGNVYRINCELLP
jgi:hypothetical protein